MKQPCPVIGFAAFSGTGKTTLLKQLIPLLKAKGWQTGIIKHTHHDIELDQPGKDSYELRHAGAKQTLLAGPQRWNLVTENEQATEPDLQDMLAQMDQSQLDLILVEGFRSAPIPKLEIHRSTLAKPFLFPDDEHIIALICDQATIVKTSLPVLDINQPGQVIQFIEKQFLYNN